MISTESIEKLFETLPAMSAGMKAALLVTMRSASSSKRAGAKLLQRGFLGCIPFAHSEHNEIVLVVRPGTPIEQMPVAITWPRIPDGITIAPSIRQFIAGQLAFVDIADSSVDLSPDLINELVRLSAAFGDGPATESVLAGVQKARQIENKAHRCGALWGTLADRDPLFEVLQGAWTHKQEAVEPWLESLTPAARRLRIIRNIAVCYSKRFGLPGASDAAWHIVHDECVFDMTYSGAIYGPSLGSRRADAFKFAVAYLREHELDSTPMSSTPWTAAQAAADDDDYDGSEHLSAAMEITVSDPHAAFMHLANAVYFSARTSKEVIPTAFEEARRLAKNNGWEMLSSVLEWAGPEN